MSKDYKNVMFTLGASDDSDYDNNLKVFEGCKTLRCKQRIS